MQVSKRRVSFCPIARFNNDETSDGYFDPKLLPFDLANDVFIEEINSLLPDSEFDAAREHIGSWAYQRLRRIRYALVHRFDENHFGDAIVPIRVQDEAAAASERKVRETAACMRLIRPTNQDSHFFQGRIENDGSFSPVRFDVPAEPVLDPINQRNFDLRIEDAVKL